MLRKVKLYMECGATGVMFGRNMWLRPMDEALALTRQGAGAPVGATRAEGDGRSDSGRGGPRERLEPA